MKHVHYRSLGNTVGLDESIEDYWEIDDAGHVVRSVHLSPDGTLLKYDQVRAADEHGALPEGTVTDENLADSSFGHSVLISVESFEHQWARPARNCT